MGWSDLNLRQRDKNGEISHNYGNTLVRTLRKNLRAAICGRR